MKIRYAVAASAIVAAIAALLLPGYFKSVECPFAGHKREIAFKDGVPVAQQAPASEGDRTMWLGIHSLTVPGGSRLKIHNYVAYHDCRFDVTEYGDTKFAEVRDPLLTETIREKREIKEAATTWFKRAPLTLSLQNIPTTTGATPEGCSWGFTYYELISNKPPPVPDWFPLERLTGERFVGMLKDGFLFRGDIADQYFWVAVNGPCGTFVPTELELSRAVRP